MYSLGILLWQLDSRSIPYPGQHPQVHFLVFPSIYYQVIRWSCSKWSQWLRDPGHQPHLQLQSVCRNLSRSIQLAGRRRLVRGGYDRILKNWKVVYIQGAFFNCSHPKISKYKKKTKYPNCSHPTQKCLKCGKGHGWIF